MDKELARDSTMMGVHQKKTARISPFFCNLLSPIPNLSTCPSSPGAIEPIPATIPFDLLKKMEI
jgi:hypothetical protein